MAFSALCAVAKDAASSPTLTPRSRAEDGSHNSAPETLADDVLVSFTKQAFIIQDKTSAGQDNAGCSPSSLGIAHSSNDGRNANDKCNRSVRKRQFDKMVQLYLDDDDSSSDEDETPCGVEEEVDAEEGSTFVDGCDENANASAAV